MFKKFTTKLFNFVSALCCCLLCFQILLVFITVVCRNLFKFVPIWGESLTLLFLVWVSMIGAALPIRNDSHIRITLLEKLFSKKGLAVSDIFVDVCCVIYSIFIFYAGIKMAATISTTILNGIGISKAYLYSSIPVAMILFILAFIEKYYDRYSKNNKEVTK